MKNKNRFSSTVWMFAVFSLSLVLSGCAPALIAGGAVGGYAIAKNTSDDGSSSHKK